MSKEPVVRIFRLSAASTDPRGYSFTLPVEALDFLGAVKDIHIASIVPNAIRGDHFHLRRREVLIITYASSWALHWDEGVVALPRTEVFDGEGVVAVAIEPGCSHAIQNNGEFDLLLCALSSEVYDPTETIRRVVSGKAVLSLRTIGELSGLPFIHIDRRATS